MADVVISYAREDRDVAHRLAHLFEIEGWTCWWDPKLSLGSDFRPVVTEQMSAARAVVVLWSASSRSSRWVAWELGQAQALGRGLVELVIGDDVAGVPGGGPLVIDRLPHIPPMRDRVLAAVASAARLVRRCEGWDSRLHINAWRDRPPKRPVIGWEWVGPGGDEQLVRRERWTGTPTVTYGTTIGNFWMFGHEGTKLSIGYLDVTQPEHRIQLPRPDPRAERRERKEDWAAFTIPFNVNIRLAEAFGGIEYPGGGVDLSLAP